jgi:hypothetical protein
MRARSLEGLPVHLTDVAVLVIVFPIMAAILFGIPQFTAKYFTEYRIDDSSLQFLMFGACFWKCPLKDILDVKPTSFWKVLFGGGLNLMCRPFGPYILLHRRNGFFSYALLTPADASAFVNLLDAKIKERDPTVLSSSDLTAAYPSNRKK